MSDNNELYAKGPAHGAKAPILIAHLEGALDAGSAGTLAVVQLLHSLNAQRVATFDVDRLIDFRSHRPVLEVEEWVTTSLAEPEIALDLIHDDQGQPILVLHGQEPDARWLSLTAAIDEIADDAGVEAVFSFHGLPAAVPHTRPTAIHIQSTDRDLIPDQAQMGGVAKIPSPYTSYLQHRLSQRGLTGVTLLATVPYYLAGSTFPRASSALIRKLADMAGLSLPVGDLERGADEDATQVEELLEQNQELQNTVEALEQHYDTITGSSAAEGAELDAFSEESAQDRDDAMRFPGWERVFSDSDDDAFPEAEKVGEERNETFADAIGDAIESYLKTRGKGKLPVESTVAGGTNEDRSDSTGSPVEGAPGVGKTRHTPRHRAPKPWEAEDLGQQARHESQDESQKDSGDESEDNPRGESEPEA